MTGVVCRLSDVLCTAERLQQLFQTHRVDVVGTVNLNIEVTASDDWRAGRQSRKLKIVFLTALGGTTSCLFKARSSSDVNMAGRDQSPTSTSNMPTKITDRNHNVESKRQHRSTRQTYRYGPEVNSSAQNNTPETENERRQSKR